MTEPANQRETVMLGIKGRNGGAVILKLFEEKVECMDLAGCTGFRSQEPLPPYELDPIFSNPAVRNRIGRVIAKAMEQRFAKT
jgi:hypothetical protein